jgi:DNA-binding MarR family transcriptional regulator
MSNQKSDDNKKSMQRIGIECLGFNVRKTARVLAKAFDETLAPCGLKNTQFSILVGLHVRGPVNVQAFSNLLKMDRTTLTRNLGPLERQGLIRINTGSDRRSRSIALTDAGEELLQQAVPLWQELQKRLVDGLGNDQADQLRKTLRNLTRVVSG